ncbi:MAG: serine/threonine-protein kinase [Planctomycetota bacterium]
MQNQLVRCGKWVALNSLGRGGQGEVYLARALDREWFKETPDFLRNLIGTRHNVQSEERDQELINVFNRFWSSPLGALKRLRPLQELHNPNSGLNRFRRELKTLKSVEHSAIVKILDESEDEADPWFVMEYHTGGVLTNRLNDYRGDPVRAISALRPIIEAVRELHNQNVIHRDIKSDNILVSADGRLVLGDMGIVFASQLDQTRETRTMENVGTRDWMPPWGQGSRIEDIRPTWDVFSLAKVLWAMVSGKPFMRLHYFDDPQFDLETLFPNDVRMREVNSFLGKCISDKEARILQTTHEMLSSFDQLLANLNSHDGQLEGDISLPSKLFPGGWHLQFKSIATEGKEDVNMTPDGYYKKNGQNAFRVSAIVRQNERQITLFKNSLNGTQYFIENLYRWSESVWAGADQFGHQVKYVKSTP